MAHRNPPELSESQREAMDALRLILGHLGAKAPSARGPEWNRERREWTGMYFVRCGAVTIKIAPDGRLTTEVR